MKKRISILLLTVLIAVSSTVVTALAANSGVGNSTTTVLENQFDVFRGL